jgi:hypothetical protein
MDILEKLATQGTQDEEKRSKNTTQYALDTAMRKPTQARQTTEGKNEPNIVFMRKSQHRNQNVNTHNMITHTKNVKWIYFVLMLRSTLT